MGKNRKVTSKSLDLVILENSGGKRARFPNPWKEEREVGKRKPVFKIEGGGNAC